MKPSERDRNLTSFHAPGRGRLRFIGTRYGFNAAPSQEVIGPRMLFSSVSVDVDDILLAADTIDELLALLENALESLARVDVRLNQKIAWIADQTRFLGGTLASKTLKVPDNPRHGTAEDVRSSRLLPWPS